MLSAGSRDLHIPVKYKRDIILKLESLASGKLRKTMHNHVFEGGNTESDFPPDAPYLGEGRFPRERVQRR